MGQKYDFLSASGGTLKICINTSHKSTKNYGIATIKQLRHIETMCILYGIYVTILYNWKMNLYVYLMTDWIIQF